MTLSPAAAAAASRRQRSSIAACCSAPTGKNFASARASCAPVGAEDLAAAEQVAAAVLRDLAAREDLVPGDRGGEEAHGHLPGDEEALRALDRRPGHDLVEHGAEHPAVRGAREALRVAGRRKRVSTRPSAYHRSSWRPRGLALPQAMQPG